MNKVLNNLKSRKFLQNSRIRLIMLALLFTAAFFIFVTATLFANSSYVPEDDVQELNYERSQVYVDGTGYVLDNYTKKQHEDEEEQRTIIKQDDPPEEEDEEDEHEPKYTPPKYSRSYSGRSYSGSSYTPSYRRPSSSSSSSSKTKKKSKKKTKEKETEYNKNKSEASVKPTITISGVKSGGTVKGKVKVFTVTAVSYDGDEITGSKLLVKMNGTKLVVTGDNSYSGDVIDGENTINVTAEDGDGNKASKTVKFTGQTEKEPEKIGELNISVTADVLGLGEVVSDDSVDIFDSEKVSDAVKRYFKNAGVKAENIGDGYYELGSIKVDGILDGIPEEIVTELEEKGIPIPDNKNSLGLNDFGPNSGWMYKVDGSTPSKYMSEMDVKPDSKIEIYYTISGM